jgi:hypothetical protein
MDAVDNLPDDWNQDGDSKVEGEPMEVILAAGLASVIFSLLILMVVAFVTMAAMVTIITKAGFSGWWILMPLSSVLLWIVIAALSLHAAISLSTISFDTVGGLIKLELVLEILNWILFLVFAFSDWPALSGQHSRLPVAPGSQSQEQILPIPHKVQDPGWFQVGATNNDQGYWDGQRWTARRRWDGAGWTEVPMPSDPAS